MSTEQTPLKILGIDFSAMFRRNWEATGGEELSEAYARTLRTVAEIRRGYDRVALLCDSGPSFRRALLPSYKADREKPPAPYYEQMNRTVARLMADGCVGFSAPIIGEYENSPSAPDHPKYAEADDLCGSLAAWCANERHDLTLYGGDKDLLSCIQIGVTVWRPDHIGRWDEQRVAEDPKLGVKPMRIPDWLALGGDTSDGFKMFPGWEEPCAECNGQSGNAGCKVCKGNGSTKKPGIGPGNASKLLGKYGSILAVVDAAMSDDPETAMPVCHQREVIRRAQPNPRDAALLGLRLATLVCDLPVDWTPLLAEPEVQSIAEDAGTAPTIEDVEAEEIAATSTAIIPRTTDGSIGRFASQYKGVEAMMYMADKFYNSRMFGTFPNAQAIFTVMWLAQERGEKVGHALINSYVTKPGQPPGYLATYLAARVKASPVCKVFRIIETTADHATVEYQRVEDEAPNTYRFDLKEAQDAGWIKSGGPWASRPRAMLRAAALREAARAFFYDIVSGMGDADEYST